MEGIIQARNLLEGKRAKANQKAAMAAISPQRLNVYKRHFLELAKQYTDGQFIVDRSNRDVIRSVFLYMLGQPSDLDLEKGLWLEGSIGTGKSTLMQVCSFFLRYYHQGFRVYTCSQVATEFSLTGNLDKYLDNHDGFITGPAPMCFDELGREPIPAKYFGTELNVMQHILHIRYTYWQLYRLKTCITTNLTSIEVEKKYGDYIRDRRKEMFNILVLDGSSRR